MQTEICCYCRNAPATGTVDLTAWEGPDYDFACDECGGGRSFRPFEEGLVA